MTADVARASLDWLTLREPADADARAVELVTELQPHLAAGPLRIHDLGAGTGSMRRWLSPLLPQEQHWIEHDRDVDLLGRRPASTWSSAGRPVTFETRESDITRIPARDLDGVDLITASALLDMFTADELVRFVDTCMDARCPSLLTLSVVGRVTFEPREDLDAVVAEAFNDHQRRTTAHGTLLGPDAAALAAELLTARGATVLQRPSTWRLGQGTYALFSEWFDGWLGAACEQHPELVASVPGYAEQRRTKVAEGRASVSVHHVDILVLP